jgi:uncharacterized integral membrane protein (TIGR00698 family)
LLQLSIVGLGFGINLHQILQSGKSGLIYTAVSIAITLLLGLMIGVWLKVRGRPLYLISVGTAICGGSAIAAVAPVIDADDSELSLETVFILNSVALILFPLIGSGLQLTQQQFGLWAALAIHDASSVVATSAKYGEAALAVGTTVKLTRGLWIIPVVLITAFCFRRMNHKESDADFEKAKAPALPWFILLFLIASILATYVPGNVSYHMISKAAKMGLTATLFLIGTGITRKSLRAVGFRTLMQGLILWIITATSTLFFDRRWSNQIVSDEKFKTPS